MDTPWAKQPSLQHIHKSSEEKEVFCLVEASQWGMGVRSGCLREEGEDVVKFIPLISLGNKGYLCSEHYT